MENNNAPFYVGQRVVRTGPDTYGLVHGNHYHVSEMTFCPVCGHCNIGLKEVLNSTSNGCMVFCTDKNCLFMYNGANYDHRAFAPIDERSVSIPESLKEQAEEMISVKETVQEVVPC